MKKKAKGALCLLLTGLLWLTGCGSSFSDEVIARIDGREVMKSEYMVYLYTSTQSFVSAAGSDVWDMDFDGMTGAELVQERAFSTIQSVVAAEQYAEENGISLTEDQKTEAHTMAEEFLSQLTEEELAKMGVDQEQMETLMEESYLYSVVYGTLAKECEVNADEMEQYYQENADALREEYTQITIDTIMVNDEATAKEVSKKAKAGEDFATLFETYDTDTSAKENGGNGQMTLYQNYLNNTFGLSENLTLGEITDPIEVRGSYFILKVESITPPTDEQVKQLAEDAYRQQVQSAYVESRLSEMIAAQEVEKIPEAWENMETFQD